MKIIKVNLDNPKSKHEVVHRFITMEQGQEFIRLERARRWDEHKRDPGRRASGVVHALMEEFT